LPRFPEIYGRHSSDWQDGLRRASLEGHGMSTAISAPDSVTIEDVGPVAASLVRNFAGNVTGSIADVDAGYHVMS
jgi:enoyl-[acyl-carrier-protein] reductase (NADH)